MKTTTKSTDSVGIGSRTSGLGDRTIGPLTGRAVLAVVAVALAVGVATTAVGTGVAVAATLPTPLPVVVTGWALGVVGAFALPFAVVRGVVAALRRAGR